MTFRQGMLVFMAGAFCAVGVGVWFWPMDAYTDALVPRIMVSALTSGFALRFIGKAMPEDDDAMLAARAEETKHPA